MPTMVPPERGFDVETAEGVVKVVGVVDTETEAGVEDYMISAAERWKRSGWIGIRLCARLPGSQARQSHVRTPGLPHFGIASLCL